ncbi:MAG: precorrin-3B C(17)-methyltransferase [Bacillota bacterium]|nr:precorrin-3B C(17)-methyltransferase [Bacillota bacterium]
MKKLYVIGIGPGGKERMTQEALKALADSEVIVAYTPYLAYVADYIGDKETYTSGMKKEIERCQKAIDFAREGRTTSILSTGDAGLYGMAGPILELLKEDQEVEVQLVPGVTSVFSAAAELGAPIMHDLAIISLSDLMTPWELIQKRVDLAAQGDFVIGLYNPRSKGRPDHLKTAIEIMLKHKSPSTPVGVVKNSGRDNTEKWITSLGDLDYEKVDMLTVLIIGNKASYVDGDRMVTPRGYDL